MAAPFQDAAPSDDATGMVIEVGLILITGAAGFIGSNLVRHLVEFMPEHQLVGLDALTYSGSLTTLADVVDNNRFSFVHGDITDRDTVRSVFEQYKPSSVIHLAAESHVDRSIVDPLAFVQTNVVGTVVLLQETTRAWGPGSQNRFHHVSTDEVFGALGAEGKFDEASQYDPKSPYSASKAASDHFVRAWGETYDLDYVITNCTNNYGPFQFPEKLIPVVIDRALTGHTVPVYGDGSNVRDWLYVEDHCRALRLVLDEGETGATYCIGGDAETSNLDLVTLVLDTLDELRDKPIGSSRSLISFVQDRPGHDFRYAMDTSHIERTLGWKPSINLGSGIRATVAWYLTNREWIQGVASRSHEAFQETWYAERGDS